MQQRGLLLHQTPQLDQPQLHEVRRLFHEKPKKGEAQTNRKVTATDKEGTKRSNNEGR